MPIEEKKEAPKRAPVPGRALRELEKQAEEALRAKIKAGTQARASVGVGAVLLLAMIAEIRQGRD